MDFRETLTDFWDACGDRPSWESGLTDVLAKKLLLVATETELTDDERISVEGAMINYGRRKAWFAATTLPREDKNSRGR